MKFQAGQEAEKRPSSRLRKEVLLNNSQYQKILELMLDLEKKIERRFTETQHETAKAIVNALDISQFKKEIDDQIQSSASDLERKFDDIYSQRTIVVEDELDK